MIINFFLQGLIGELINYNLRRGTPVMRGDVRQLICLLVKDNRVSTEELNSIIMNNIITAVKGHLASPDFVSIYNTLKWFPDSLENYFVKKNCE